MTFRYLDKDGAISFWTNIKNYILSKIPTKTSEIQNDSGYITNTDTCLHKSGGETFTGYKTVENINSGLIFKSTDYQAEIRLSGNEPYDVSIVSHKLSNDTYSYFTLMDRYGKVFPHIYRSQDSNLTVYVSNAVSNNDGDGLTANTAFSYTALKNFLSAIRMRSGNNIGGTYTLTINLIPTGTSYGTCRFDSTKMPYVKNLIIQTSTGVEGTPENYTTNCPELTQLYISGNIDVTVRNIKCGEIGVYQGAKVNLTNFNAVGQVRADNNGYVIVGGYLYVFYFPLSAAPRASLFDVSLDGHIRIENTNTTINFSEQVYYTAGVMRAINHGYLYANISRWKLLGIKPCVIAGSSTTVLTTCSTPGNVSAKTVETGTTIGTSSVIGVTFSETNTANNPTLNVNSLGDWPIVADNNAVDIKHYLPFGVRIIFKRFRNTWKITNTKDILQYIAGDCSMYVSGTLGTTYNNGEFNFGGYIVSQSTSSTNTGIYNAVQYNINGTNIFDGSRTITQPWVYTATPSIKLTTTIGGTSYQDKGINFKDTNNVTIGYLYGSTLTSGSSGVGISASNIIDNATVSKGVRILLQNDGKSYFCPGNPNDTSLGSEYFTWKGVYANKYYLGSTEFGDIVTHNASEFLTQHQSLADYATKQDLADLVNSAPSTLDTLNELASALGNDPNFATTVSTQIGTKANDNAVVHLTGNETINGTKVFKSDKLISTSGNSYRIINNSNNSSTGYGVFQRIDSGNWYLMLTAKDDALGSWASPRPAVMNLSTGVLNINGNSATATEFSANKSVTLTGDVTGTASSKGGWTVSTTLANSGVTAGTYGPSADVTGNNNATISVPEITVDSKGRVTSVTNRTLTCKNNTYNVYNKTLTIQKNGTNVATFTSNSNTNVTANITVPTKTSELTNDSNFLTTSSSLNASKLTGTIDIARLPQGALERVITVADQTARFALTTSSVQLGDTVKQLDTGVMYVVVNESKLNSNDGYLEYTAGSASSVPWSGITSKPTEFTPSSHTHTKSEITDFPTNVSAFTNDSGYLTSHQSLSNYVTLDGTQTIAGTKTFSSTISGSISGNAGTATQFSANTTVALTGDATGTSAGSKKGWSVPVTLANSGVTAGSYGPATAASPAHGGTFSVPYVTVDAKGRVTAASTVTITLPADSNTDTKVTQTVTNDNACYPLLIANTASASHTGLEPTTETDEVRKAYNINVHARYGFIYARNSYNHDNLKGSVAGGNRTSAAFYGSTYDGATVGGVELGRVDKYGNRYSRLYATNHITDGALAPDGTAVAATFDVGVLADGTKYLNTSAGWYCNVYPTGNNTRTLGTSSLRWKECYSNAYYLGTTAFGDIVTHNASEFLTSHQSLSSCVKNTVTNSQTIKSTAITRGTAPSSVQTFGIAFTDNNNKYIGNVYGAFGADKSTFVGLYAYKGTTTSNGDNASVRVGYDASGNAYTYAPTPATTDNSTQIATTAFVKAQGYLTSHQSLANYVTTNTDQSISGIKSHSKHISILGDYIGNEASTNGRSCLYLKANRDTDGKSGLYVTKFRQNVAQGSMGNSDVVFLSHDILENETRTNAGFVESYSNWANNVPGGMSIYSSIATRNLGTSAKPWTNAYITNLILNGNAFDPTSVSGNIGDIVFASAYYSSIMGTADLGLTVSGDALYLAGFDNNTLNVDSTASSLAGTWKFLGIGKTTTTSGNADTKRTGLWKRIA